MPARSTTDRCYGGEKELDCFASLAMTGERWVGGCEETRGRGRQMNESFLLLFFKKEGLSCFLGGSGCADPPYNFMR